MKQSKRDDGFRMSDALWERMEPLLPAPKAHPLDATGRACPIVPRWMPFCWCCALACSGTRWTAPDCVRVRRRTGGSGSGWMPMCLGRSGAWGLLEYDELKGIDWSWLALDGAMTKAPLGGEKNRPQSMRPR